MRVFQKIRLELLAFFLSYITCSLLCQGQAPTVQKNQQEPSGVVIDTIVISGNTKTKKSIITRELNIKPGDTIREGQKEQLFKNNQNRVLNTNLFVSAKLQIDTLQQKKTALKITVKERWYTFPQLIFELADRNFNEWWYDRGQNLKRISYGIRLFQNNVRGHDETLKLTFQHGFTPKYGLSYDIPYIDNKQRYGINTWFNYARNREKDYVLLNHSREFLETNRFIYRNFESGIKLYTRKGFFLTHSLSMTFNHNTIHDTLQKLNPDFFSTENTMQRYFTFQYSLTMDKRNRDQFAENGYRYFFEIKKMGITPVSTLNMAVINAEYAHYFDLGKKFYAAYRLNTRFSFPDNQPYANTSGLGYSDDFVRGYELYAINGQHHWLFRTALRKKFFSHTFDLSKYIPIKQFGVIPIDLYLTAFNDFGYVHHANPDAFNKKLSNKLMRGTGAGLNLVTYYDSVFRLEYSVTKELEKGFFIHFRKDI